MVILALNHRVLPKNYCVYPDVADMPTSLPGDVGTQGVEWGQSSVLESATADLWWPCEVFKTKCQRGLPLAAFV